MSYGVVRTQENPGDYRLAVDGEPIPTIDGQNLGIGEETPTAKIITKGFGIPAENYGKVQEAFAGFLTDIQNAAFIQARMVAAHATFRRSIPDAIDPHAAVRTMRGARCSTLSVQNLKNVMRQGFEEFIRKVINLLPPSELKTTIGALLQNPTNNVLAKEQTLAIGDDDPNFEQLLKGEDFLTPAARQSLDQLESGTAGVVNETLIKFAAQVLHRASLSLPSTMRDGNSMNAKGTEGIEYSTLNPDDLTAMVRRGVDFILPGIVMSLPQPTNEKIMNRAFRKES